MNYPKIDFLDACALRSYYESDMKDTIKFLKGHPPGTFPSSEWCVGHARRRAAHWQAVIDLDLYEPVPWRPSFDLPEWRAATECSNNGEAY